MKLLAWDTSSKAGALVAMEWLPDAKFPQLISELSLNVDLTHSERLLWGIHQILESARWSLKDVDLFGVGVGPGSFTGLRIGVTTARTLAHSLKKPLIGVSSLAALARPVSIQFSENKTLLIAATDACKGELFALWGWADQISSAIQVTEVVMPADELVEAVLIELKAGKSTVRWAVVGEARLRYPEVWKMLPAKQQVSPLQNEADWFDHVQGRYLGLLAFEAFQSANYDQDPLQVTPRYLRVSDAERKLQAGLLKSPKLREKI